MFALWKSESFRDSIFSLSQLAIIYRMFDNNLFADKSRLFFILIPQHAWPQVSEWGCKWSFCYMTCVLAIIDLWAKVWGEFLGTGALADCRKGLFVYLEVSFMSYHFRMHWYNLWYKRCAIGTSMVLKTLLGSFFFCFQKVAIFSCTQIN